ncbi:LAMI_0H18294g1_1 [Lachancea mirantina]|uniref:LAMI_0H18294g1_1 n=1 Tax=Lachancea mirantina TaxID=1230905 RepID=A0A1G4KJK6_9SACH|nr:LAMI_0H18294g1_1 [Lachancea mirantina]
MDDESCVSLLEDKSILSYKSYWLNCGVEKYQKIFELFSFGNVTDVPDGMVLSELMWKKIRTLTLLTLFQNHRILSFDSIRSACRVPNAADVEELTIALRGIVDFETDEVGQKIEVLFCKRARDVYCGEKELLILPKASTSKRDLEVALTKWKEKLVKHVCHDK